MRLQIFAVLGFVALACATPLVDKKQGSSLRVVDIPAGLFSEPSDIVEDVQKPVEVEDVQKPVDGDKVLPVVVADEAKTEDNASATTLDKTVKGDANETEETDRPAIFGFRLPTIVILRRPAIFDDPFSFFPFQSFNRRPAFSGSPVVSESETDNRQDEDRPIFASSSPSGQRPVSIGGGAGISDMMFNMRQQMDSLFSNLFAPNPAYFPNRQFFPRPFFPSVPSDASSENSKDESLDFDNLPKNYKNSTSETKVVDGQVIEVNKTVHKISGDNSNGFFQFSVIKIRPSEAPVVAENPIAESANIAPAAIGDVEKDKTPEVTTIAAEHQSEMNDPTLNEVDQDEKDAMMTQTKYETDPGLLEVPNSNAPVSLPLTEEVIYDFVPLKSMPLIEAMNGDNKPRDLSSDLRVNNLMANGQSGQLRSLVDPDEIEIIEV